MNSNSSSNPPPPRYTRYMSKFAMRWPLIFTAGVGLIWSVASGVYSIKDMGDEGETAKQKVFDLLLAIMYFVVAGVEGFVFVVGIVQNLKLAKFMRIAAYVGVLVAVAAQIIAVVQHFIVKGDLIAQCVKNTVGARTVDRYGQYGEADEAQAQSWCNDSWDRGTWKVFVWLVIVTLLAVFFAGIAMSYYYQLTSPAAPANQSIPLQSYPPPPAGQQGYYGAPPQQEQSWMVPPYPGPPPPGQGGQSAFEKTDYQPAADWAQDGYAPPSGPPPAGSRGNTEHREEEEAWERARTEGVTAHLTGHGPGPRRDSGEAARGYGVSNTEEDEAWERARSEGVTAHYTGHNKPRRDGDVV